MAKQDTRTNNLKQRISDTKGIYKAVLIIASLAISITIQGCSTTEQKDTTVLDREKIDTETTDSKSRREYYTKYVDEYMNTLTEEEKEQFL